MIEPSPHDGVGRAPRRAYLHDTHIPEQPRTFDNTHLGTARHRNLCVPIENDRNNLLLEILLFHDVRARVFASSCSGFVGHVAYFRGFAFLNPYEDATFPISGGVRSFPCIASAGRNKQFWFGI
jgi:hypothetical protein